MKVTKVTPSLNTYHAPPVPPSRVSNLRDAFNASAAPTSSAGVLATSPLSMASAAGIAAAMTALPPAPMPSPVPAPAKTPRKDAALVFNHGSLSGVSLLNGLLDNSFAAAIMKSAAEGDAANLALLLTKQGTLPDFTNAHGMSPLMVAAARGQAATLAALAAHPLVNLARADAEGWTALHFAAHLNQREAVALLLKHHAPFDFETAKGQIAFDLGDAETQVLFVQDKNFKRYLKSRAPEHPLLQPPPAVDEKEQDPPPETGMDADEPEDDKKPEPLQDALFTALTGIGLSLQKNASINVRAQLNAKMAEMDTRQIADAYRRIAQTGVKYNWDDVFIRAAGAGNTAAMVFLQDEVYFEQRVLNRALWEAAATAQRDAAHHLMLWEADPGFAHKTAQGEKISAIDLAWQRRDLGVIEEMALWSEVKKTQSPITGYLEGVRSFMSGNNSGSRFPSKTADDDMFMPLISLSAMQKRRDELGGEKSATLKDAFARVAQSGNITEILAIYAEAQRPRFLRGKISFDAAAGGKAMGWALAYDRVTFARKLAADGYKLADAPKSLQDKVLQSKSAAVRDFAKGNLSGTKHYPRIEETGKRSTSPSAIRQLRTGLYID